MMVSLSIGLMKKTYEEERAASLARALFAGAVACEGERENAFKSGQSASGIPPTGHYVDIFISMPSWDDKWELIHSLSFLPISRKQYSDALCPQRNWNFDSYLLLKNMRP